MPLRVALFPGHFMVPKATDLCTVEDNYIVFLEAEVFLDIQARGEVMLVQGTVL